MHPNGISPAIIVEDTKPARSFYTTHFNGKITFDCGWYVNIEFGDNGPSLQFMQPQSPEQKLYKEGLTFNLRFTTTDDVDAMHTHCVNNEFPIIMPLEDHPWGDRGFATLDPYGVALYIYADTQPDDSFKDYFL